MAFGISLCLDQAAATGIEAWWQALAEAGLSRSMPEMRYRPHITLGVYETLDPGAVISSLESFVAGRAPPTVLLSGLGVFPADPSILWAVPAADATLLDLHRALHDSLQTICGDHYLPGRWVPHCTLATDLAAAELGAALEILCAGFQPIPARLAILDLVRFHPVEILWRSHLTE